MKILGNSGEKEGKIQHEILPSSRCIDYLSAYNYLTRSKIPEKNIVELLVPSVLWTLHLEFGKVQINVTTLETFRLSITKELFKARQVILA